MSGSANIAAHLSARAQTHPTQIAYQGRIGRRQFQATYAELDERTNRIAHGLRAIDVTRGTHVALMQPPGPDFFALVFALFRLGTVPILIDPGMGVKGLGKCLAESEPAAFIGTMRAHIARILFRWAKGARIFVRTTGRLGPGLSLTGLERLGSARTGTIMEDVAPHTIAAILFTSGSTGPAKGAVYTYEIFQEQIKVLKSSFNIEPGEIDLCTFPLFALFAPALGMTAVVPDMDASRPAQADPAHLARLIQDYRVTNLFGSPALVKNLAQECLRRQIVFDSVKRVISAGAPVSATIIEETAKMLAPRVQVFTPYGATEALPAAIIGSDEILGETRAKTDQGAGICVGRPAGRIEIAIIPISDGPIAEWTDVTPLSANEIGEIAVRGRVVSPAYFNRADLTALAKIPDRATDTFWHRMGDVGYIDDVGRLWFCGRKSHRVVTPQRTYFTIPCEAIFNMCNKGHLRTALVCAQGRPVICVEWAGRHSAPKLEIERELREAGKRYEHTRAIRDFLFYSQPFPVDVRHNAKINREKLAEWAARQLP
ncbi:MAG: fatty acid CoA ligase family protein [Gemmataceae bacterium]